MAKKRPSLLKDLDVSEVSLVDSPANQHSLAVLFKRYNEKFSKSEPSMGDVHVPSATRDSKKPCPTCGKVHTGECMKKGMKDRITSFIKSFKLPSTTDIEEIPKDDDPDDYAAINARFVTSLHKALEAASPEDALIATGAALEEHNALVLSSVSKGLGLDAEEDDDDEDEDEGVNKNAGADATATPDAGASSGDRSPTTTMEKGSMDKKDEKPGAAAAGAADATTDVEKKDDEKDDAAPAEIAKKNEEIVSLTKRLEAMEKKEKERAANDEATTLVGKSGIAAKDVATLLTKLDGDAESTALLKGIVSKAATLAKNSQLFEEIGADSGEDAESAEFTKAFEDIKKANPKLTDEQVTTKVYEEHPELYDEDDTTDDEEN